MEEGHKRHLLKIKISSLISTEYTHPPCFHSYLPSSSTVLFLISGYLMAVIGNLSLLLDVTSPRTMVLDRSKARLLPSDIFLNLFKKDLGTPTTPNPYASLSSKGGIEFEKDATIASHRGIRGRKANSKFNEVDYESSSDEDNGNGYGDEEEVDDERKKRMVWEEEMRMRVKEIEDMRELEKKAEELQSRGGEDEGESGEQGEGEGDETEETEEEKRMRVRRELEKVMFLLIPDPIIYAPGD